MEESTICMDCKYAGGSDDFRVDECLSKEAPYTDFVHGIKQPWKINEAGNCSYFKAKHPKREDGTFINGL